MGDLANRKVFKVRTDAMHHATTMTRTHQLQVFNQEFIVDERYNVTKELGQGAYGIVWCDASAVTTPIRC